MRASTWSIRALVLAIALPFSAMAHESGKFAGWADIDSSGRLSSFAPDAAANPALVKALRYELQQMTFVPARRAGNPVAIRTYVTGEYTLEPKGDEYVLHVAHVEVGPKITVTDFPTPPQRLMTMNEAGWVHVSFRVGRDGKAHDLVIEDSAGPSEMRRNVRNTVTRWRFQPETIDGSPVETQLHKSFAFAMQGAPSDPRACPTVDNGGRVLVPGQPACEVIDIRFSRIGTGRVDRTP